MNNQSNGIYIHLPFCIKKCAYCDFVSYENQVEIAAAYVDNLLLEMEQYRGEQADTVYLGGGTPTALPPHLLVRILDGVKDCFNLADDSEITVETNPGTCQKETISALKKAGANRISLGAQTFVDTELSAIGRIHTAAQIKEAVLAIRAGGIQNISLDLMFSLPGQTEESLLYSLEELIALNPNHISCYSLTLCEGTPLYEAVSLSKTEVPDEESDRAMYELICGKLKESGFDRYEISNFAKKGYESRHNTKYWIRASYIGLGAAAHSFFGGRRFENPATFSDYEKVARGEQEREGTSLTEKDAMAEFMFLGLRMIKAGVSKKAFFSCFKKELDKVYKEQIARLCRLGLLEDAGDILRLTNRGVDVSNSVFCEFV
ncbi:MAG: radical SAM family heme chaperone HemW [Clostridia bacterium]|nr:radical SAM family heme chaperone HemW [Clostridia bacterium]